MTDIARRTISAAGFLFDMDGTLVDSTGVADLLWGRFAGKYGLDLEQVLGFIHGRRASESVDHFFADRSPEERVKVTREFEDEEVAWTEGIVEVPGAADLVKALLDAGAPVALVTSAPPALAEMRLRVAGVPALPVMVTAHDVSRGKPAPDPFLLGAQRLGLSPADCAAFEDAEAGLTAALSAGAQTIVVGPHVSPTTDGLLRLPDLTGIEVVRDEAQVTLRV